MNMEAENTVSKGSSSLEIPFHKYQGAGNDFIIVDNTDNKLSGLNDKESVIRKMCERRFGIGADGFIEICRHNLYDFEMLFHNNDGALATLCGNGMRCALAFCKERGIVTKKDVTFQAFDGLHFGLFDEKRKQVHVKMVDVNSVEKVGNHDYFANTGSPHHVHYIKDVMLSDVRKLGREICYNKEFTRGDPRGINVNFVEWDEEGALNIRTYERGVEDETLACGTGSVAAVLVNHTFGSPSRLDGPDPTKRSQTASSLEVTSHFVNVNARGGKLAVSYDVDTNGRFHNIFLIGPAEFVYSGVYSLR